MHQIYPDEALINLLNRVAAANFSFHLYTSPLTINQLTTLATLAAVEAAWAGYAPISVLGSAFTSLGVAAHNGTIVAPAINFGNSSGAGQLAYGYYVTDAGNALLIAAAAFDGAPVTVPNGGTYPVVPILGDSSQYAM